MPVITATPSTADVVLKLAGDSAFYGNGFYGTGILFYSYSDNPSVVLLNSVFNKYNDQKVVWGFYDFYGWGSAQILVEGLRLAGKDLTRKGLLKAMESMTAFETNVFGPITFTPDKHNGNNQCIIMAPVIMPGGANKWIQVETMRPPSF